MLFCKKNPHVWKKMPIEGAIHLRSHSIPLTLCRPWRPNDWDTFVFTFGLCLGSKLSQARSKNAQHFGLHYKLWHVHVSRNHRRPLRHVLNLALSFALDYEAFSKIQASFFIAKPENRSSWTTETVTNIQLLQYMFTGLLTIDTMTNIFQSN